MVSVTAVKALLIVACIFGVVQGLAALIGGILATKDNNKDIDFDTPNFLGSFIEDEKYNCGGILVGENFGSNNETNGSCDDEYMPMDRGWFYRQHKLCGSLPATILAETIPKGLCELRGYKLVLAYAIACGTAWIISAIIAIVALVTMKKLVALIAGALFAAFYVVGIVLFALVWHNVMKVDRECLNKACNGVQKQGKRSAFEFLMYNVCSFILILLATIFCFVAASSLDDYSRMVIREGAISKYAAMTCTDCQQGINKKVELECGHGMCEKCISKYTLNKFLNRQSYEYKTICSVCNKSVQLTSIIFGGGRKWTVLGSSVVTRINSNLTISYQNDAFIPKLYALDVYLINDYEWFNTEYSAVCQFMEKSLGVQTLNLSEKGLGYASAIAIGQALKKNASLTQLYLRRNKLGNEGAIAIGQALEKNTSLTQLYLGDNEMGNRGGIAIGQALEKNASLTQLYLHDNQIGNEGAIAIAKALERNASLTLLNLVSNQIGNEGAIALAKALERNKSLTELSLVRNQIGNKGAIALGQALEKNKSLTQLYLHHNQIGTEGAIAIAKALERNASLTLLNLENNKIGNEGAIAFAKALGKNASLTQLYPCRGNQIENEVQLQLQLASNAKKSVLVI